MAHVRQQIREAAKTALTGLTTTGGNVFTSRVYELTDAELPGLKIITDVESSQLDNYVLGAAPELVRELDLQIEGHAKANADVADTLDTIAAEVEIAMAENLLGGLIKAIVLSGTRVEMVGDLDKPTGKITLVFVVQYYTATQTPETAL